MTYDIISIGSATKDVFLISKNFKLIKTSQFKTGMGECFEYGSKVELHDIYFDTGGGATNSAWTFANLGLKTSIVARVGQDIYGMEIMHALADHHIHTGNLVNDKNYQTAYSTILITPGGDRTILVYRGASSNFSAADFNWEKLINTKWFYITSLAGNLGLLRKIFAFAKKNNIKIAWNPGSAELKLGKNKLASLIKQCNIFNLNKEEAQKLTSNKDIKSIFKVLDKLGLAYYLVTDGANGAYLNDGILTYHANALGSAVVNTTGAGDAFGSAFVAGLIKHNDWDYALRLGIINSDGVIKEMGAKHGLLKKLPKKDLFRKVKIEIYQ